MIGRVALAAALALLIFAPSAQADTLGLEPLARTPKNHSYRTDYGEKKLEAGVDVGLSVPIGTSTQAFSPFASATPYLDLSFGDGNSLDFQVTLGYNPLDPSKAEYYFWRSPVISGSSASGELRYAIPNIAFRYENDLSRKMSGRRGHAFFWASMGVGAGLVSSAAKLTGAGTLPETSTTHEDTLETFLALVPATGMRFRVTEFLFVNLTVRYNILVQFGAPSVVQEGDMGGMRVFDTSLGLSYEFGPT